MKINQDVINNNVSAQNQIDKKIKVFDRADADIRITFIGNSITLHGIAPSIGWMGEWGMAASAKEKDYVHLVVSALEKKYKVGYCVLNAAEWEWQYYDESLISHYKRARDFNADIVVIKLGENVKCEDLKDHDYAESFEKFVKYFKGENTKILITDTFWEYEPVCKAAREVAQKLGTDFVVLSDLGYEDENKATGMFSHSGVASHPGDKGMARIAERILNELAL